MFGIWIINELKKSPHKIDKLQLVEFGPGKGTLMQDIIRVFSNFVDLSDVEVHLVELSPLLRKTQRETISTGSITWHDSIYSIPENYTVFVANEFFDALPIRQFMYCKDNFWREVLVNYDSGKFGYVLSPERAALEFLGEKPDCGTITEVCPKALSLASEIARRISDRGGLGLFCDYGHLGDSGRTFRAYRQHKVTHPLEFVGESDLTADVDFGRLKDGFGIRVKFYGPQEQARFLSRMGIEHRLKALLEENPENDVIGKQYDYLMSRMGKLFKFVAVTDLNHTIVDGFN